MLYVYFSRKSKVENDVAVFLILARHYIVRSHLDEDKYVRRSAAKVLRGQSSEAAINTLIAALKDEDKYVRYSAAKALEGQSPLSEAAISVLVSTLDADEYHVQDVLRKQPHFYSVIESLDVQAWRHIWSFWLRLGARNDVSCYEFEDTLYVWSDGVRHKIFTDPARIDQFRKAVLSTLDTVTKEDAASKPCITVEQDDILTTEPDIAPKPKSRARSRIPVWRK